MLRAEGKNTTMGIEKKGANLKYFIYLEKIVTLAPVGRFGFKEILK